MIAIGCDQAGYAFKCKMMEHFDREGIEYTDFGCDSPESCDYPIYGKKVAHAVADGRCEKGILVCGTGIGMSITANKIKGIRAAVCHTRYEAEITRLHNDANIICIGARVLALEMAIECVDIFLRTPFSEEERHIRRIKMIED